MELHQCPECLGNGVLRPADGSHVCDNCDGTGWLDEHGEPFFLEPEVPCANNSTTTKSPENSRS